MIGGQYLIIGSSTLGMESVRKYSSVRKDAYSVSTEDVTEEMSPFKDSMSNQLKRSKAAPEIGKLYKLRSNSDEEDPWTRIHRASISYLISILFGDKYDPDEYSISDITSGRDQTGFTARQLARSVCEQHYYYEEEETSFQAAGKVITADGRELDFQLGFSLSRSFEQYTQLNTTDISTVLCDPLVINLDSNVASVSDQKIRFDLDADGVEDSVSVLKPGSGYLALDLNDNGRIDDGSELFGTKSGNGFYDLSRYDSDGNGWIDEADDIFQKLKICVYDENGEQTLYKLKEKDIGAICLRNVSTEHALNQISDNRTNAVIRRTGIFLYENGAAGTIQHLDLAKELLA